MLSISFFNLPPFLYFPLKALLLISLKKQSQSEGEYTHSCDQVYQSICILTYRLCFPPVYVFTYKNCSHSYQEQHFHSHWPPSLSFSRTLFSQWSSLCPHDSFPLSLLIIAISRQTCSTITHLRKTKLALNQHSLPALTT